MLAALKSGRGKTQTETGVEGKGEEGTRDGD